MVRVWRWAGTMTERSLGLMVSSIQFRMMKKVDFFIVGEPKSGTSALVGFLSQHPDIYMPKGPEPYYFCTDLHKEEDKRRKDDGRGRFFEIRTLSDYQRLFEEGGKTQIFGEKSVYYLVSKVAAKNIYRYNPKAKIIVLLREPVSFLRSLHAQLLLPGMETEKSFNKALELEEKRKNGLFIPRHTPAPSQLFYLEHIKYSEHIRRFYKFFGRNSVKVIFYEDFKKDNREVYKEVLRFLGVNENFVPKFKQVNVRRKFRFDFLFSLINDNVVYRKIMDLVPLQVRVKLSLWSNWILFKKVRDDDSKISRAMKKKLDKIIETEIAELGKLLGVDVKDKWGR